MAWRRRGQRRPFFSLSWLPKLPGRCRGQRVCTLSDRRAAHTSTALAGEAESSGYRTIGLEGAFATALRPTSRSLSAVTTARPGSVSAAGNNKQKRRPVSQGLLRRRGLGAGSVLTAPLSLPRAFEV